MHLANEAKALARDGADQLLVLATITDLVSRGVRLDETGLDALL
jgi:hypothetical protein